MSHPTSKTGARSIVTVDISPFLGDGGTSASPSKRLTAGQALVEACHTLGFAKITGHGVAKQELDEAFVWVKRLFDLPYEEKMKAPHPAGPLPHRGYSGIGKEKVYSKDDEQNYKSSGDVGGQLRKIADFKESYEVGSEQDDQQPNIWLPDDVLPGFRGYMTSLYERLAGVARAVLEAMATGLGLQGESYTSLMRLESERHCQLRLLHYPAVSRQKLQDKTLVRLPAHTDWGAFTLLFQDDSGGLELRDPLTHEYMHAVPEEGTLVLNIGDMLQRFTNDYFISALHRVSVPDASMVPEPGIATRYSIPFFVGPAPTHTVATLPRFISPDAAPKYEPVRFEEYGAIVSKYQYHSEES